MTRNHGHPQPVTPTLRGRVLGTELRRAREAAGLSITELAARTGQSPEALRRLEDGITDASTPESSLWCRWDTYATSVLHILCRISQRIDIFAPLGINPAFKRLGADRCTAYVLESTPIDRTDITVRVIPRSTGYFPGLECQPPTRFTLTDGPAIVHFAYPHAAHFTEEPQHLLAAYTLFEELDRIAIAPDER